MDRTTLVGCFYCHGAVVGLDNLSIMSYKQARLVV